MLPLLAIAFLDANQSFYVAILFELQCLTDDDFYLNEHQVMWNDKWFLAYLCVAYLIIVLNAQVALRTATRVLLTINIMLILQLEHRWL